MLTLYSFFSRLSGGSFAACLSAASGSRWNNRVRKVVPLKQQSRRGVNRSGFAFVSHLCRFLGRHRGLSKLVSEAVRPTSLSSQSAGQSFPRVRGKSQPRQRHKALKIWGGSLAIARLFLDDPPFQY